VPTPQDRAQRDRALFHLRKAGVNLNQIARRLNGQQAVPPATVEAALRAARQALEQVGETV
jgi:DNA-binding transcriptional MerR regulator